MITSSADTVKFDDVHGGWTRIAVGAPVDGWLRYDDAYELLETFTPEVETKADETAAALLHERDNRAAEAGRAHPHVLPRRAPFDRLLDRPAAGRRTSQRLVARVGETRVEQRLRALDRRCHCLRGQPGTLRRGRAARHHGAVRRDDVLRAADRVADARAGGPARPSRAVAARGGRRRRAAQPRGHRAGTRGVGAHRPRRLRPDRDHRPGRQPAGHDAQARLDGPPAARLSRRARRPGDRRGRRRRRDLPRPVAASGRR